LSDRSGLPTLAVLGGTGNEGRGLALRWAHAGYDVIIGSREQEKAERTAAELNGLLGKDAVQGMLNPHAAREAEVVVLTVPYAAHQATLESVREQVQGKILVDVTVPIQPPKITVVTLPPGRTAAEEAQALLGENVRVVSAFQNVSATHLMDVSHPVNCDVLICSDDREARQVVTALAEAAGMRGIDAGPLANAIVAESLTPVLLGINKRYGVKGAGIRITEIE
jgi:NADPH-dependent F420 reductase